MKQGNWVPMDKTLVKTLSNINRPFSHIEAMFSYSVDRDNGKEGTLRGYAKLWGWSVGRVKRFVECLRNTSGTVVERKGNGSGTAIRFVDGSYKVLAEQLRNGSGTVAERKRVATIYPNPNPEPNPKKKTYGHFANVLLSEDEYIKLTEKFNGSCSEKIEALSEYLKSKGKKYKSHYATILSWDRRDKKEAANGKPKKPGFTEARKSGETNWLGNEKL